MKMLVDIPDETDKRLRNASWWLRMTLKEIILMSLDAGLDRLELQENEGKAFPEPKRVRTR